MRVIIFNSFMGIASSEAFFKWLFNPDSVQNFVFLLDLPLRVREELGFCDGPL
jgi:hypothetical protein